MIRAGIVGISGYSGKVLLRILLNHPEVRLTYVSAQKTRGRVADIWPEFAGRTPLVCEPYRLRKATELCDVIFLAVPHTGAMTLVPKLLQAGVKVIDLSADYRLRTASPYRKWYGVSHSDPKNLKKAVYGLPEFYRTDIAKAPLIANPGCYPTAALLALAPLITTETENVQNITIDAKSGVTGAGKKVNEQFHFAEMRDNFRAYRVLKHQHTPEIELYLSKITDQPFTVTFVPHLLPINQGILATVYVRLKTKTTLTKLHRLYKRFFKVEPFVRVVPSGQQPEIKHVVHTNYCDIGLAVDDKGTTAVITAAIDNLVKGAAGQAVQNMNILYGFKEDEGLL